MQAATLAPTQWPKARDDHTIGLMINGNMTIAKLLNPAFRGRPDRDLAPLSLIGTSPLILTAPSTSLAWLPTALRGTSSWPHAWGRQVELWHAGRGHGGPIGTELLKGAATSTRCMCPYPGYPRVANAMLGGQLQMALLPRRWHRPRCVLAKLRAIGVTSSGRSPLAPMPSLAEAGISNFNLGSGTPSQRPPPCPKPIQAKLAALLSEIARSEGRAQQAVPAGVADGGLVAVEGLANRIKADTNLLGGVICDARHQGRIRPN